MTIGDIGEELAIAMLRRPDIQADCIRLAKTAYLSICAKVPFDELCTKTAEREVSTTTREHSLADLDPPLNGIMSVRITYSTNSSQRMRRSNTRVFDAENQNLVGRPSRYARFGNAIEFDRIANASGYTYRIRYWTAPTIAVKSEETVLVIPQEWFELVKYEALYRVYLDILDQPEKAMMMMQPAMLPRQGSPVKIRSAEVGLLPRLWNDLLRTVGQREHVDEDIAISPMRPY
jgi:hypothetical protein